MKPLSADALTQLADQIANRWHVRIDPREASAEDIFDVRFWVHGNRLAKGDLIRIESLDGSYDFMVKVETGAPSVSVSRWPKEIKKTGERT